MRRHLVAVITLARLAVPMYGQPSMTSVAAIDAEIVFLESRVGRDDADPITPTRLGHAYLRKARESSDFSFYIRAENTFNLALARSPEHFGALTGLASALSARHAFREALAIAERAIKADPGTADGYAATGDAALEAGLHERADEMYARVVKMSPGYHADTRLANLAAARGDTAAAYAALSRALADGARRGLPADLMAWCHIRAGAIAWEHGDWIRAERSYNRALALVPRSYVALEHLAELRSAQRRDVAAAALYAKAIAIAARPEFIEAMGAIHQRSGRTVQAQQMFAAARDGYERAAGEGDPGAYRRLALFFADIERRPVEAVAWARKDHAIRQDAVTLGVLAWALLKNGAGAEAAAVADRAVAGGPVDAETWYRCGVIAMERGAGDAARGRFSRALQINPRFVSAADARLRLKRLSASR
jgi:tetratricopeptide (TPR) repeat protein